MNAGRYDDADEPWKRSRRYYWEVDDDKPKEPGFIARFVANRREKQAVAAAEADRERSQRLDDVLRRVAQVGTDGLTAGEKAFLEQESQRLRGKK